MSRAVLDASALLALLGGETGASEVERLLPDVAMSTVNLAEVAGKLAEKGMPEPEVRRVADGLGIEVVDFDADQAYQTGFLRPATKAIGLSLGDRACLALARRLGVPAITTDRVWAGLRVGAVVRVIR